MIKQLTLPEFDETGVDGHLKKLGIKLSDSTDGHQVSTIRQGSGKTIYGFKYIEDFRSLITILIDNQIPFSVPPTSTGARYEHHVVLNRTAK